MTTPDGSRWTFDAYAERLTDEGRDPAALWRAIDDVLAATIGRARDSMLEAAETIELPTAGTFELLEFDVIVDRAMTPWLLDCASWPAASALTRRHGRDPLMTVLLGQALALAGAIDGPAIRAVRLFPSADPERLALLAEARPADLTLAAGCGAEPDAPAPTFAPRGARHDLLDDRLVLFSDRARELYVLNPTASYIWLRASEGARLADIARELIAVFPADRESVERDVWGSVANWIAQGLLAPAPDGPPAAAVPGPSGRAPRTRWGWNADERIYRYLGWRTAVRCPGDDLDAIVHATLSYFEAPSEREYDTSIEVIATARGYEIRVDGVAMGGPVSAAHVAPAVHRRLLEATYEGIGCVLGLRATIVGGAAGRVLLLNGAADERTALSAALASNGFDVQRREPLLIRRDPMRATRRADPDVDLGLHALVVQTVAPEAGAPSRLEPLARADALHALLVEDLDMVSTLDAAGASALVHWTRGLPCAGLTVGAPVDAVKALGDLLSRAR